MSLVSNEIASRSPADEIASPSPAVNGFYGSAGMIDQLPVSNVLLSSLEHGLFLRGAGTDPSHVRLLADAASSSELPPILVQSRNSRVVDGMHRLEAAKLRGEQSIRACFIDCTDEDAFILAVKSNTSHGLPLSRADRVAGAERILACRSDWSDRAVGAATGLSAKTIAGMRSSATGDIQQSTKRLGRDGKRRPLAGAEGRSRAADCIAAHPDASLREIAREADVSLGTVHDVRARMRRGADPHTEGRDPSALAEIAKHPTTDKDIAADRLPAGNAMTKRNSQQPTWPAISSKLANDPSLRYTEGGRIFFRWMTLHAMHAEKWKEFINVIPAYWLKDVSFIADWVSEQWREFAQELRDRQKSVY